MSHQVLVRDIEPAIYQKLKTRAHKNGRSLEAELRLLFQAAVDESAPDIHADVARVRELFAGRQFIDSTELLREDRDR